ncbi:hypothetical protein MMC13_004675 [Lambiella insularis]|nr:hypothetical protein [Lambiella insularis]
MQFSKIAFVAALAAPLASAQNLSGLPSCALTPAISSLSSTGCALTDIKCICDNTSFLTGLQKQVTAACDAADLATATTTAAALTMTTTMAASPVTTVVTSATPSSAVVVSVISDGQPQVPTNATTLTTPTVTPFKGAAATAQAQFAGVAMLVGAVGAFFAL